MAYAVGTPGKLHSASNKVLRPRCNLRWKGKLQRVNRSYAEEMALLGLLCKKCYPNGLPVKTT